MPSFSIKIGLPLVNPVNPETSPCTLIDTEAVSAALAKAIPIKLRLDTELEIVDTVPSEFNATGSLAAIAPLAVKD